MGVRNGKVQHVQSESILFGIDSCMGRVCVIMQELGHGTQLTILGRSIYVGEFNMSCSMNAQQRNSSTLGIVCKCI